MLCYMLGGRAYRSAATQPTFAQRGFLMGTLRAHGIDRVINQDGDVLGAILAEGCASKLLAGLLVQDGGVWSRETALANAKLFDGLTSDEEFADFCAAIEALLAGFFPPIGSSATASPTFSDPSPASPARKRPRRRKPLATTPTNSTENGLESSPSSPTSTASV